MFKYFASALILFLFPFQTRFDNKWKLSGKWLWTTTSSVPVTKVDCLLSGGVCTAITVVGDSPSGNPNFSGYADPNIKKDPNTGTFFMSYSWPNGSHGAGVIDTHIAKSTDSGATWTYVGDLYPTQTQVDTTSGLTVYSSNEVSMLLPIDNGDGTTNWMVCRLNYWKPGGGGTTLAYSSRMACAAGLGNATQGPFKAACTTIVGSNCTVEKTPQYLGTNTNTNAQYPIDVNMQTLPGAVTPLASCTASWREPTAILDPNDGKLVLFLQCNNLHFYAQFVTNTSPGAGSWAWSYIVGSDSFAVPTDVSGDLCTYTSACALSNLAPTELDVALNAAGTQYGTVVTVGSFNPGRFSTGCVWAELDTSARPYLFKKTAGKINVDSTVTSSDSVSGGPGSCTYQVAGDIVIAHKTIAGGGALNSFPLMHSTLKP